MLLFLALSEEISSSQNYVCSLCYYMSFREVQTDLLPCLCFRVSACRPDKNKFLCQMKKAALIYCQKISHQASVDISGKIPLFFLSSLVNPVTSDWWVHYNAVDSAAPPCAYQLSTEDLQNPLVSHAIAQCSHFFMLFGELFELPLFLCLKYI